MVRQADRDDGARLRAGVDKAAAGASIKAVIPVGEAWTRAMQTGIADPNPYDGVDAGKLDLWTYDHYHASTPATTSKRSSSSAASPDATRDRSATASAPVSSWVWIGPGQGAAAGRVRRTGRCGRGHGESADGDENAGAVSCRALILEEEQRPSWRRLMALQRPKTSRIPGSALALHRTQAIGFIPDPNTGREVSCGTQSGISWQWLD